MYRASIENKGDSRYHVTTKGGAFVLDTEGNGANPVDTLLASLCGCVGHYVRDYLLDRSLAAPRFTIDAEGSATSDGSMLSTIAVWIDLREVDLDERARSELLSYVERCKVLSTLRAGCTVELQWGRSARPVTIPAEARGEA
jgi:uncharacterized OsmC-like protein